MLTSKLLSQAVLGHSQDSSTEALNHVSYQFISVIEKIYLCVHSDLVLKAAKDKCGNIKTES